MSSTSQSVYREIRSNDLFSVTFKTPKRSKLEELSLSIPNFTKHLTWNLLILGIVVINFILVTLNLSFKPNSLYTFLPFYAIFDIIYLTHFVLLVLHNFYKPLQTKITIIPTPLFHLTLDALSLLPQLILLAVIFDNRSNFLIPYFRLATLLRLRWLVWIENQLKKLQKRRWAWLSLQYCMVMFLVLHSTIVVWYLIGSEKFATGAWYFMHVYGAAQILFGVGFGDVFPRTSSEVIVFIWLHVVGLFLVTWLVASITLMLINNNTNKISITGKEEDIARYLEDTTTQDKALEYYKSFWAVEIPSFLEPLPAPLKSTLLYDMNCGLLKRSMLLRELPELVLKTLASSMKHIRLQPGDVIYHQNVVKTGMVCVESGNLEILHNEDGESPVISFRKGTILGEVALFFNFPSKANVVATKLTDLSVLEKSSFMKIMRNFPDDLRGIRRKLQERFEKISAQRSTSNLRRLKRKTNEATDDRGDCSKLYKVSCKGDEAVRVEDRSSWILDEESFLLKIWKHVNGLMQITYCVIYPYLVVFERVEEPMPEFGFIVDILCLIDLIFQCITMIRIEDQQLLSNIPEIINHKLDDWRFVLDTLSLFPIEVWGYLFDNPVYRIRYYNLFKLNRLLRLNKLIDLVKLSSIPRASNVGRIILITLYAILSLYYFSCILYLNACFNELCHSYSWYYLSGFEWAEKNQPKHPAVDSIFFASTAFFFSGFVDFLPRTYGDVTIILIVMFSGLIFNSFFTSKLITYEYFEILHMGSSRLRLLFKSFSSFCHVSLSVRHRIQRILMINPCLSSSETKDSINKTASPYLKTLADNCKLNSILAETSLLQMVDRHFLALVGKEAKLLKLPNNETLYSIGNTNREMFILQKGYCDVYNSDETFHKTVGPGFQFGLLEMLFGFPKKHTITTSTDCIFFRIEYSTLHKIFAVFPKEQDTLEGTIHEEKMTTKIKRLLMEGDLDAVFPARDQRNPNQACFINQTKNWTNYCRVFRRKLGYFWLLGVLLMPVSIHPEGFFIILWCSIRCFLIVVSCILEPIMIFLPPFADELYWWLLICHMSIYFDMYLSLHIAYFDGKGGFKIHPAYTSWYYLTHGFLLDLITVMPWEDFMLNFDHKGSEIDLVAGHYHHSIWKLVKLLQMYKVFKFIAYFKKNVFKSIGTLRLVHITLAFVMVVNVFATLGISQICQYRFDGSAGMKHIAFYSGNSTSLIGYLSCTWKHSSLFQQLTDPLEVLMAGVFEVVNIITTTSLGHLQPATSVVLTGTILLIIIGFIISSTFTSLIAVIMLGTVDETIEFRMNITKLMNFLKRRNLCSGIQKQAFRHFELTWERSKGQGDRSISFQKIQAEVPFFNDILLNYYQNILEDVPLFYDLDVNLLRMFVDKIKVKYFRKGQTIVRQKDLVSDIYIVASGQVELIPDSQSPTEILEVSAIFGNIQRSIYSMCSISVVARKHVELWVINTAELFNVVKYHPVVLDDMDNVWKKKLFYIHSLARMEEADISIQSQEADLEMESEVEDITRKSSILLDKYKPVQFCIPQRWFRFALKSNHDVFKVLDLITLFSSILNVYAISYVFVTQESNALGYVYLAFEPVYYLRIFFKLHQIHVNFYGNLVKSNSKIYKKYLNSPLQVFWDVVPNLPLYLTCFIFSEEDWFFSYSCLRLLQLLRVVYISRYFSIYGKKLGVRNWLPLVKIIIYYGCLTHILSCVCFMLCCPFDHCLQRSWITKFGTQILERHVCYRMILSYYYVFTLLTTTGVSDISPENKLELFFTLFTILIGKIMISVMIGSVLRYIYQSRKELSLYELESKLLIRYLENRNVSNYLIDRTWGFLENQWNNKACIMSSKIFEELPYPLRQDISLSLYGDFLKHTFLFKDIDESLLRQICCKLKLQTFFEFDHIVQRGVIDATMYFILQGDVCVSTKHDDLTETQHVVLHARDLFGVAQGLGLEVYHNFNYRPYTHKVEILTLCFEDWGFMLGFFPEEGRKIFGRVQNVYLQ